MVLLKFYLAAILPHLAFNHALTGSSYNLRQAYAMETAATKRISVPTIPSPEGTPGIPFAAGIFLLYTQAQKQYING